MDPRELAELHKKFCAFYKAGGIGVMSDHIHITGDYFGPLVPEGTEIKVSRNGSRVELSASIDVDGYTLPIIALI